MAEGVRAMEGAAPVAPSDLAGEAARLALLGLNPVPIDRGTKRPTIRWENFQSMRFADCDPGVWKHRLDRWWRTTDHQLGVLTGELFDLVVLDCDTPAALAAVGIEHATVVARTPRGGSHWWFRFPPGDRRPNRTNVGGLGLDVRSTGGVVVVPPSERPDGRRYRWVVSPHEWWPPTTMPERLVELCWPTSRDERAASPDVRPTSDRYVRTAFESELAAVAAAAVGVRNDTLNRSAYAVARFVRAGEIPAMEYRSRFLAAAATAGLGEAEVDATLRSALKGRTSG